MLKKSNNSPLVSIIIPVYNEDKHIEKCLKSVRNQSYSNYEIIVVDDGSTDLSSKLISKYKEVILIKQQHGGPGYAKNNAAKFAKGIILLFIDGDMYLDVNYLKNIIKPLFHKNNIATYTTAEFVANIDNIWAKCWNINLGLPSIQPATRINLKEETLGLAFRAILRNKFILYHGFDSTSGYIDDRSIDKIRNRIVPVDNAICYHFNPDSLVDVFLSARWIGRSSMFTLSLNNLFKYSIINSLRVGINKIINGTPIFFLIFKIIFDLGLLSGIIHNNLSNNRSK